MIQANYIVQNPHMTQSAVQAIVGGEQMLATVDTFEVELVADDLTCGTIKLRFNGPDIAGAQALFAPDAKIIVQFATLSADTEAAPA